MWPLAPFSQPATRCPTDAPCSHCAQGSTNNATCFIGPHRIYDPWTKSFMNLIPGQGHFGPDAIPGVSIHMPQPLASCAHTYQCSLHTVSFVIARMPAGAAASRSRSRRPATRAETRSNPSFYPAHAHTHTHTTPCTDTPSHQKHLAHRMVPLELAQHAQMVYTAR